MHEIVQSVRQVSERVGAITTASDEQRLGIEEVNSAISQMDQVTQQNAKMVEQALGAAENLREQADHLNHAVSVFQTEREGFRPAARPAPAARGLLAAPVAEAA